MPLRQISKGVFLHVRATPKAGRNEIVGIVENATGQRALAIKVSVPADKGAANRAVIETLADEIGVAKSSFRLTSGQTARDKVLEIAANDKVVRAYILALTQ